MSPDHTDLWFLPLGGCGEIGMNLNLYGHDDQWLMIDCGVTFADPGQAHQPHVQMPDPGFIAERADHLAGIVITHAHEDHLGALPYLWRRFKGRVYTTAFTAEVLRRKLIEFNLAGQISIDVVKPGDRRQIGPFNVEWLNITHSIPEPQALMIRTPVGSVFHTADWKLDPGPVIGPPIAPKTFQALAEESPSAMVCDSTNALVAGHSVSESELIPGLRKIIENAKGRVVVSCFASNVARLVTLMQAADQTGRRVALLGRSLKNMVSAAKATGYWDTKHRFIDPFDLGFFPREHFMAIATGSQGEPRAALSRLARDTHPDLTLEAGDTVVFSARIIPGNELLVESLIKALKARDIQVITAEEAGLPIHASGHPAADELTQMYQWVKPELAIPVHGEKAHMAANAKLARGAGVTRQLTGENGDLFYIKPVVGIRRKAAMTGRLGWDRDALIPVATE